MKRSKIYKFSKYALVGSFFTWLISNIFFTVAYGNREDHPFLQNVIEWASTFTMDLAFIVLIATIINKLDEEMETDETRKTD